MKLIYIANARIPTEKAHGIQIMQMLSAFANVKCQISNIKSTSQMSKLLEVELIIPRRFNSIKDNSFDYYGIKRSFTIRKLPCLDLIPLSKYLGPVGFWVEVMTFNFFLFFYLLSQKADIFYSRDWSFLPFCFCKKNFIFEAHKFPKKYFLYSFFLKRLKGIVVLTTILKGLFMEKKIAADKILVASDAVDLKVFDLTLTKEKAREILGLPQDKKIIGYSGRFQTMDREKGLDDILRVLTLLEKEVIFLAVGGSKSEIAYYQGRAEKFGIGERVIFLERVSQPLLAQYQKACDVLLMPFPNIPHYASYMSPLKMFEYMASGRPIVAADLPSIREVLHEKNAILVEPGNPESLLAGIKKALDEPDLVKPLVGYAYKDVQNYTWQKRAEKIIEFISSKL